MADQADGPLADLIARARGGDRAAWGEIYLRHGDTLRSQVRKALGPRLRRHEDSTDIVNSVLKGLPEHLQHYPRHESERGFLNWATKLVVRKVSDKQRHYRALKRGGDLRAASEEDGGTPLDAQASPVETPSHEAAGNEERELLRRALKDLEPKDREALALFGQGLSPKEIGERLGCSPDAGHMRVHRARAKLERAIHRLRRGPS